MKIRIKFSKTGVMKFVGHLDTMRYFQRAIRRAGIDISYTTGFSPHPIMSFALPLGVGIESVGEYFDIKVNSTQSSKCSIKKLNEQMADGIEILSYKSLPDNAKKSMSLVEAADYVISVRSGYTNRASRISNPSGVESRFNLPDSFDKMIEEFYSREEILITKQTKKSERELNIKPLIFGLNVKDREIFMRIKAGSVDNIKPELVLEAIYSYFNIKYTPIAFSTKRLELYTFDENNNFLSLDSMGEEI